MEPKNHMPGPSPEAGGYQRQEAPRFTPEQNPMQPSAEALPARPETKEVQPQSTAPVDPVFIPAVPAQPILPRPAQAALVPMAEPSASAPLMAGDDDLIEQVWVQKAKKVIQETKGDPYAQEREVSKLQADYIKKRYGKDIKIADE